MFRTFQVISFCILINGNTFSQAPTCDKVPILIQTLAQRHLQPPVLNDAWATRVYDEFFFLLDPHQVLFTQTDLDELKIHKVKFSGDPAVSSCALIQEIGKRYATRIAEAEEYVNGVLKNKLAFNPTETAIPNLDDTAWLSNHKELEYQWLTEIKYLCLLWMQRNASGNLGGLSSAELAQLEERARTEVLKSKQLDFARLKASAANENNSLTITFYEAIAHSFDPHTEFFTPELKEKFFNSLDIEGLSFGIEWTQDTFGRIKISNLIPGGAAWQSNELNQGDELLSVSWNEGTAKDVLLYDLETLSIDFESTEHKAVSVTVKKSEGQIRTVSLMKSKIELAENSIHSYVLRGSDNIGYILLPGFYGSDGQSTKGCTDDVAREILKLKKENIVGLILDLRFNGGGSLLEAINLAGIFVDAGPLALLQEANQPAVTLKDVNRGMIYSGPLIILINGYSASASELVSAALQDLNRAILVGSKTYGKATGQIIEPIPNPTLPGFVKVTNDRLYRVTGKSLQQKGIIPDITLPDVYEDFVSRELSLRNSIVPDSINKKVYYTPLPPLPLTQLRQLSEQRKTISFKGIMAAREQLKKPIPLHPILFAAYSTQINNSYVAAPSKAFTVSITGFDATLYAVDNYRKIVNDEVLKEIQNSKYVEEAFHLIQDYITITKTK